jgi:dihydropteroate synthase
MRMMFSTPAVMGVINLSRRSFYSPTPDFSDALTTALEMVSHGAAIIDVGAIATNPQVDIRHDTPSIQEEIDLVVPFIEALSKQSAVSISVDTSRAASMRAAVDAGATMINDQCALMEENALETAVKCQVPVCLMHHFNPARMAGSTSPAILLNEIKTDLKKYTDRCMQAGLLQKNIIVDPGFGGGHFGKNADENFYLLSHLDAIIELGFPVLVGLSRKSLFESIAADPKDRLFASVAGATIAAMQGAAILRVHDVKATAHAMCVVKKVRELKDV